PAHFPRLSACARAASQRLMQGADARAPLCCVKDATAYLRTRFGIAWTTIFAGVGRAARISNAVAGARARTGQVVVRGPLRALPRRVPGFKAFEQRLVGPAPASPMRGDRRNLRRLLGAFAQHGRTLRRDQCGSAEHAARQAALAVVPTGGHG